MDKESRDVHKRKDFEVTFMVVEPSAPKKAFASMSAPAGSRAIGTVQCHATRDHRPQNNAADERRGENGRRSQLNAVFN